MPRKTAPPDPQRTLMIKTKTCQRLLKEVTYYKKEVKENEEKLAQMKKDNCDPYDIKKFEEVLGESYMMVPDSEKRLQQSLEDLAAFMDGNDVLEGEWVTTANSILQEHAKKEADELKVQETIVDQSTCNNGEIF